MVVPSSLPEPGMLLGGKYRIERLLGRGGMGAVYAAEHEILKQRVAVKLLLSAASNPEGLQRFINEARAAAQLDSEHVTRVMDMGALDNGMPFMVLEYLEGGDLGQLLAARGPLPITDVVDYVLQACEALAHAHAAGIIHRDLKPSNLYLARRPDGTTRVKVLDFGISKMSDHSLTPKALTHTSSMLGTPYYMSPEQMVRPKQVDSRTDVWQLGVTIYELLQGSPPFGGDTLGELMYAVLNQPLPSITQTRPDVPPGLEQAIHRCLERDVARRFQNVAELGAAMAPFGSGTQTHLLEKMNRTLAARPPPFGTTPAGGGTLKLQMDWTPAPPQPPVPPGAWHQSSGRAPGAVTGPGGGTAPLETGRSWGQASAPEAGPRQASKAPLVIAGALVGVIAIVAGALVAAARWHPGAAPSAAAAVATPPSAAALVPTTAAATGATIPPAAPSTPAAPPEQGVPTVRLSPPVESTQSAPPIPEGGTKPRRGWGTAAPPTPPVGQGQPAVPKIAAGPASAPHSADQLPDNSRQ